MHLAGVKQEKVVDIGQCLQMANDALDTLIGLCAVHGDNEAVITAHNAVVYPASKSHQLRCRIARRPRSLRDRHIIGTKIDGESVIEDAAVLRIHSRLDCSD